MRDAQFKFRIRNGIRDDEMLTINAPDLPSAFAQARKQYPGARIDAVKLTDKLPATFDFRQRKKQ